MARFPFRTALVTGASSGIGESIVELLAADGVKTVVVARREGRLNDLAARFDGIEVLVADLNDAEDLAAVIDRAGSEDDPVELVVNNAGFGTTDYFHNIEPERIANEIGLNVSALTQLSRAALGVMKPRGTGWLINVSSVAGFQPAPRFAVYAATKAFVTSLSESLHEEAKAYGVNVTAVCPGLTTTEFIDVSTVDADTAAAFPDWMFSAAAEVASAALEAVVKNRAIEIPGIINKAAVSGTGLMPRSLKRRLAGLMRI